MLHLKGNIRLVRLLSDKKQRIFADRFKITEAMLKSYEGGKANPDELFVSRVAEFAGVSEKKLKEDKLRESDIHLKVEKVENVDFKKKKESTLRQGDEFSQRIIFNLSESNRQQAEANNKQAEANLKQVKNNEDLIAIIKTTVRVDQQTLQESVAMILGLREYLIELGSHVNKASKKEVEQLLNNKVKRAKERAEKMDTLSEERR